MISSGLFLILVNIVSVACLIVSVLIIRRTAKNLRELRSLGETQGVESIAKSDGITGEELQRFRRVGLCKTQQRQGVESIAGRGEET